MTPIHPHASSLEFRDFYIFLRETMLTCSMYGREGLSCRLMFSKNALLLGIFLLSFLLLLAGLAYFLYLHLVFPQLVPHHGSGERFGLNEANNYTSQIPWSAYVRLHLTLQANNTVSLYVNDDYVCDCTHYDFVIEQGEQILVLLKSESPVSGMFRAWQEIPIERQVSALILLSLGIIGIGISIGIYRKRSACCGSKRYKGTLK